MKLILTVLLLVTLSSFTSLAVEPPFIVPIDNEGIQRVEVVGGDYFFKPKHIVVKVNVPVEFKVRKEGLIVPHDIIIKAPEAGININESLSRDPKTFFFVPTKTGKYPVYCGKKLPFLKSHRDKGMEGVLEVVD